MASLQEMLRKRGRTPTTVDGEEFMPNGRPSYGMGARRLMPSRVGAGMQSSGMTTGGGIGSALMMGGAAVPGMAMGGVQQQPRQPAVNAFETAKATATRMQQSGQRAPTVMQTQDGNTRVIGSGAVSLKPNEEQLAKRSAFADAMEARRGRVQERGIARGQEREERMQFASDAQTMGRNPALIRAFERQGITPERAAAMMQGNMQFLSEDNRQRALAGEAGDRTQIERDRLAMDREDQKFKQDWLGRQPQPMDEQVIQLQQAGQAAYDAAKAANKTDQEAMDAAMQASMGKYQRYGTQAATPAETPASDTRAGRWITSAGDTYEAATGLPQWTGPAYGWMPGVPHALSYLLGSEKRKAEARKRMATSR